jgi:DNA-binding response OmpR family regulator
LPREKPQAARKGRIQQLASIPTVLLVEGRKPTAEHLAPVLDGQEYNVITTNTRRDALATAQEVLPAVIVLDAPSLRFDSRRFCETLQEMALEVPVLMLLPEGAQIDRSDGARAHLRHPFSAKKLANRITRLLPIPDDKVLQVGAIVLNLKQRCVICGKRESNLTPKQAALLEIFMRHPGEVLTRGFLMKQVWNTDYVGDTRTLEVHIHWLRKALEEDAGSPALLRTVRRVGYRFNILEKKKKRQ